MVLQELNVKIGLLLDEFQKNSQKVKDQAKGIEGTFSELKGFLVGLGVFEFMKVAVTEFADHERAITRLEFSLKSLGGNYQEAAKEVKAYAEQIQAATGVEDDDAMGAMTRLTQMTGNYREAMALMPDILDIVASGQMELAQATDVVGRAFMGDAGGLGQLAQKFGIATRDAKDFGTIMEKVRSATENSAASIKDTQRNLDDLNNLWKQFKENAGAGVSKMLDYANQGAKVAVPMIESANKLREAQNKLIAQPVNWVSQKVAGWLQAAGIIKTQAQKLKDAAADLDEAAAGDKAKTPTAAARPTVGRLSKEEQMKRIADAETAAKSTYDIEKKYGDQYLKLMQQNTAKVAALYGKQSAEYKKHKAEELKAARQITKDKIDLQAKEMDNLVAVGAQTDSDRLAMMQANSEKIKELWGAESQEYQDYMANVLAQTQQTYDSMYTIAQGVMGGISDGFTAAFEVLVKEGATGEKAFEAFARAMGRSFLNAVASAIDAEIVKGTASYLSNMLAAGPWGAAPVSAYSLPVLAALAATSGMIHGLAGAMEEGGVMTRKGAYIMAEKPSGEPEAAIPFSRMGEAFEKYSQFMDKSAGGKKSKGSTVIIQRVYDNRGAVVAATQYDQNRAAKNVGDMLVRRGIVKR